MRGVHCIVNRLVENTPDISLLNLKKRRPQDDITRKKWNAYSNHCNYLLPIQIILKIEKAVN
jgi:uncharacterized Zn finger protein